MPTPSDENLEKVKAELPSFIRQIAWLILTKPKNLGDLLVRLFVFWFAFTSAQTTGEKMRDQATGAALKSVAMVDKIRFYMRDDSAFRFHDPLLDHHSVPSGIPNPADRPLILTASGSNSAAYPPIFMQMGTSTITAGRTFFLDTDGIIKDA